VVALAPPLAALSAYALVRTVRLYRRSESAAGRLALPALTAVTLGWAARLSSGFPAFLPGIAFPLVALAITAVVVAVAARRVVGGDGRVPVWTAAACCALMLAVPAVWSLSVFDAKYAGSSGNANAGGYRGGFHFPGATTANAARTGKPGGAAATGAAAGMARAARVFNPFNPPTTLDAAESSLMAYLAAHRDGARYLVATESWGAASPYILAEGAPVLPMGGFSGDADFPQPQQFTAMVRSGEVRYVLLTGRGMHAMGGGALSGTRPPAGGAATSGITSAVAGAGVRAPGETAGMPGHSARAASAAPTDLSRIADEVAKTCQLVPMSAYDAVPQETAPLYHCG
jgi:hypothetical protein